MAGYHRVREHRRNGRVVRSHLRRNPGPRASAGRPTSARPAAPAAVFGACALVLWLGYEAVRWLEHHWLLVLVACLLPIATVVAAILLGDGAAGGAVECAPAPPLGLPDVDGASPREFEIIVGNLLRRDGLSASLVGGGNDMAVDVVGSDQERGAVVAVQCKHTTKARKVGAPVLYQISGTAKTCYDATHQVIVTNGGFTEHARAWGRDPRHRVHLIDREALADWLHGRSIYEFMR